MSTIEDSNKVDAIGIDKTTGFVVLKIFDHLDWDDEQSHLFLLQNKINSYLRFLESEDVLEAYPDAENKKFQINISFLEKPTANGLKFLETVSRIVLDAGFEMVYSIDAV